MAGRHWSSLGLTHCTLIPLPSPPGHLSVGLVGIHCARAQLLALTVCRDPFRSSDRVGGAAGMTQWKHKPEPGAGPWTEEADGSKAGGETGGCSAPPPNTHTHGGSQSQPLGPTNGLCWVEGHHPSWRTVDLKRKTPQSSTGEGNVEWQAE